MQGWKQRSELNFNSIEKTKIKLNLWLMRDISLYGRVLLSKAEGLSRLVYVSLSLDLPPKIVKDLDKIIYSFIWCDIHKNDVDILKQHLKTSVRKLKLGRKWIFQMDNNPKHTSKVVAKWLKDNKVKVLEWPSQSPDLNPIENLWAELKKGVRARRPTNLTQLHQLCQEEWAKIHPTYCGKLVESYPKRLTQVKPFKGNATKY